MVAVNGLLMVGAWFLLPAQLQDDLFRWHGPFAFPLVLAGWMYSDVPATNVLGADPSASLAVLDDGVGLRRLLTARSAVLWLLVTPVCLLVALGIGAHEHRWTTTVLSIAALSVVPLGPLGVSAWVGIRWPYHPIALRQRWAARRDWRHQLVRWGALVVVPYALVPALCAVIIVPTFLFWASTGGGLTGGSDLTDAIGAVGAALVSLVVWRVGQAGSGRLVDRRRPELRAYLADPSRG